MRCKHEAGDAMHICRRSRVTKLTSVLLTISIILYLLLRYEAVPLPTFTPKSFQDAYDLHPTYEYTSIFRTKADKVLEVALESKLVFLEQVLRSNRPKEHIDLLANRTIWQIASPELADERSLWVTQWRHNNHDWRHKLYTSPPQSDLLPLFESIPEIADTNKNHPDIRNDLQKYLLLWYHGGFWSEIDTWNRVALRNCKSLVSVLEASMNISLMVGVDKDEPFFSQDTIKGRGWSRGFGFGQSTIWAPRRFDPIIRKAIVRTISHAMIQATLAPGTWRNIFKPYDSHASEVSGAGMFTDIVLEVLSQSLKEEHILRDRDAGLERRVSWKHFKKLREVLWITQSQVEEYSREVIRGLAVLPIDVWGSGQAHSGSGSSDSEDACVNRVPNWRPERNWKEKIFG